MGILSWYSEHKSKSEERYIQKALKTLKNSKSIREERSIAIQFFKDHPNPEIAIPSLLQRFEYSLEHGINDTREKESCMDGILKFGNEAGPLVKEHLMKTMCIAWPIKIIKQLYKDPDDVASILLDALDYSDVTFAEAKVDKNYDILCYLVEYKKRGISKRIAHFLNDPDERVRFACAEVIMEQDDPEVRELLEPFIPDLSAENGRIHQAVSELFAKKGWPTEKIENPENP